MENVDDSVQQINCWKAHSDRTINQDPFRISLLDEIKDHEALPIMNWDVSRTHDICIISINKLYALIC